MQLINRATLKTFGIGLLAMTALVFLLIPMQPPAAGEQNRPAPDFTHKSQQDWINSSPLDWQQLRGKVVLLDIWTFDCWNCYRSFPWLTALEKRHPELQVIGIHAPEFAHEKVRANIEAKMEELKLDHPVMIDNDFSYWNALGNRYWPSFYLVDKKGQIRLVHIGETHEDSRGAVALEETLKELLGEPG